MSNEEHVEEILFIAYKNGLYNQILNEVNNQIDLGKGKNFQDVVFEVFYRYVKLGKVDIKI